MRRRTGARAKDAAGAAIETLVGSPDHENFGGVALRLPAKQTRTTGGRAPVTRAADPGSPLPPGAGPGVRVQPPPPAGKRVERHAVPRRRPRWPVVILSAVVVLLTLGLGAYGVLSSGFFRIERVQVRGASLVSTDEVADATGAVGRNLYEVDPVAVRARVEGIADVRQASVRRVWPRGLVVTVTERTPAAVWRIGAVGSVVDGDGVVLDAPPDPSMLTINQTGGASGLAPGDRVDGGAVTMAAQLRDIAPAQVGQRITRFDWSQASGLAVTTDKGLRVLFGDGINLDYKLSVWRAVLDQARRDKTELHELDLRSEDRAVYR